MDLAPGIVVFAATEGPMDLAPMDPATEGPPKMLNPRYGRWEVPDSKAQRSSAETRGEQPSTDRGANSRWKRWSRGVGQNEQFFLVSAPAPPGALVPEPFGEFCILRRSAWPLGIPRASSVPLGMTVRCAHDSVCWDGLPPFLKVVFGVVIWCRLGAVACFAFF